MLLAKVKVRNSGMELVGADQWCQIGGGAYFWDDLQQTSTGTTSATDVPTTNLIPLPR